jgi:leader peptidase (prepilin peptidase) / N-methyltransferase
MDIYLYILLAVAGSAIGSFLNVLICRIPEGLSVVFPASHCPRCKHAIRYYDNIPVISYLLLRGMCRDCREKISIRYPLIEILTGLMCLLLFWKYGLGLQFVFAFVFVCSLIVITFIDFDHQIIPDMITLPGIPLFSLIAVLVMGVPWLEVLIGIIAGGGFLYAIAVAYELITKREGMGGGDIKLLAMMGGFLGWKSLLFIVFVSSLVGALVGITIVVAKGKDMKYAVPFGPFLSMAAVLYLFIGQSMMMLFFLQY